MSDQIVLVSGRIKQAEGYLVSDMGGDKVMMSIQSGKYFNLGQSGGTIWGHLSEPTTLEDIVGKLCEEYEIDRDTCTNQVAAFLQQLASQGLIISAED